ncbi:hypothetical protein MRX96_042805 [Rhipicephalus microplus]
MPPPSLANPSWRPKGRRHHRDSGGSGGSSRNTGTGGQQRLFRSREYGSRVLSSLSELRESGMLCDVTVRVDGEEFVMHRVVLAASCPYFAAMFHSGLAEADCGTVEIRGVSASIADLLFGFIYAGEILITRDNCQDLLAAANMFRLADVVQACCDFLQRELHPSNCVGIFRFAEMHACTNLKLEAKRFIERRFTEVINEEEFYELPTETLRHFLKSEGLSIDNEFQVFDATMKWILHNVEERRSLFFDVLEAIRFPVISRPEARTAGCALTERAVRYKWWTCNSSLACALAKASTSSVAVIRHTGMRFGEGYSLASVERFDPARGQWAGSLAPMAHPRSGPGAATLNQLVYVAGGESDCLILDSAEVFDPVANRWDSITPMVQPRCMMGMCALDGCLYAVGGWVGAELGDTIEKYDPDLDTWQIISRMTVGRYAMGVLAHEGLIYVIGGYNDLNCELALVESYNPVTNEWQTLAPLRKRRAYVGVAVLHDHIYAVGGSSDVSSALNSVERYSIEENRWTELPPMSMARVAETYDPEVSMWCKATPMPLSRCYAAAVVV